ncbi:MAG: nucleotidyltransferase domain-containing protein [Nanoarchaeota archaeon]|nr:nucleotidyltransferase domain-containing protein [Nanoarchaeota archaeon]MCG2720353.1 nucleotidyltransferase domain-containing protein [Nanoarchaeota archaeon]
MNMYKLKFTKLQNEIFRLLCIKAGMSINQRGIARLLKVSPTAIAKATKLLEKEGLVKVEKSKTMNLLSMELNRNNPNTIAIKRTENLNLIQETGIIGYLEENFPGCTIILFGSYSTGEDTEKSDIDIAIINSKGKELDLSRFDKLLERTVFLHFYKDFNSMEKELKANIFNGIVLSGAIEL